MVKILPVLSSKHTIITYISICGYRAFDMILHLDMGFMALYKIVNFNPIFQSGMR